MRILHSGDWHLTTRGTIAGRSLTVQGIPQVLRDRLRPITALVSWAQANQPDLILIPGDVFHSENPDDLSIKSAIEAIDALSEVAPVVIVRGNHDGGKGAEVSDSLAVFGTWKSKRLNVYVAQKPEIFNLIIQGQVVRIFCLPYPRKSALTLNPSYKNMSPEELAVFASRQMEAILQAYQAQCDQGAVNILVGHFSVAGRQASREQLVPPYDLAVREEFLDGFDYVALGHLHLPQKYFSGALCAHGFGDEGWVFGFDVFNTADKVEIHIETPGRQYKTYGPEEFLEANERELNDAENLAVRIKGQSDRMMVDKVNEKIRSLKNPFIRNALEIINTQVGADGGNGMGIEDLGVEEAIRLWAADKQGVNQFIDALVKEAKDIESDWDARRA